MSHPSGAPGAQPYGEPGTGYAQGGTTGYATPATEQYGEQHTNAAYGNTAQPMTDEGHPVVEDISVGQLLGEVSKDLSTLMRQELELAKAEIRAEADEAVGIAKDEANKASAIAKEEAVKADKGAGMLGGAGFAGYMVALFLSFALWWGLENLMDAGLAALIVGVLWAIVGAVLYSMGRKQLKRVDPKRVTQVDMSRFKRLNPKPEQTVDTLQQVPSALKPS